MLVLELFRSEPGDLAMKFAVGHFDSRQDEKNHFLEFFFGNFELQFAPALSEPFNFAFEDAKIGSNWCARGKV